MKRVKLAIMLAVIGMMVPQVVSASDYYDFKVDGIYYKIDIWHPSTVRVSSGSPSGGRYSGNVVIPSAVTYNGKTYSVLEVDGFAYCKHLTSVTIPNSVTKIGDWAFKECISLKKFYTGKNVETIGSQCFDGCYILDTLILGESIREIGYQAFKGCERITQIYSLNYIPPTCDESFPTYVYRAAVVHVPNTHNAVARYQAVSPWKSFFEIYDDDFTGVEATSINATAPASLINLNGQYISDAQRGILLQKMPDGTTKKVLMR